MALVTMTIDPNLTGDEIIAKINEAASAITRGSSVSALARPIEAGEVGTTEIEDGAVTKRKSC